MEIKNGKIIIFKKRKNVYKLKELLSKVSDKNIHVECKYGSSVGKEMW